MNKRVLTILLSAFVVAALCALFVYGIVRKRIDSGPTIINTKMIVAANDIKLGGVITAGDLTTTVVSGMPPRGAIVKPESAIGRGAITNIFQGEPIVDSLLAAPGAGGGLAATIGQGMRAAAVKVDDVVGIAGFATPGMRVDVLITGTPPNSANSGDGTEVRTLLQNIEVLSAGTDIQKAADGAPKQVQVVNLLVTPDQAEVLSLASNQAHIQLVLRNPLDTEVAQTSGTTMASLFSGIPQKPRASSSKRPARSAAGASANNPAAKYVTHRSHQWFHATLQKILAFGDAAPAPAVESSPGSEEMSMRSPPCLIWLSGMALALCTAPSLHAQAAAPAPTAAPASAAHCSDASSDVSVGVGKSILLDFPCDIQRVSVGLGDFAVANPISGSEIIVNGKSPGETSLIVWENGGSRQIFNLSVYAGDPAAGSRVTEAAIRELHAELPGQAINVSAQNGNVFLRGTVNDISSAARAVQIASTAGKVVNLLDVKTPPAEPQIMLKVVFASLDRSKARTLGINFFNLGLGNAIGGITTGQFSPPVVEGSSGTAPAGGVSSSGAEAVFSNEFNLLAFFPGLKAGADINALENDGIVQVLAQPNVIAQNGKQASFLAGGEYPYPVVQGGSGGAGSSVAIQFKEFGIRLNFIPTITPRGTIRLQVAPEVSSLDFADAVTISGFTVPAITTRKMNTEVELKEGDTFVIGGLLDNHENDTFQALPWISSIPIIGKLSSQSKAKTRTRTSELMVLVTPVLVNPIPAGTPPPAIKFPNEFLPSNSGIPMTTPAPPITPATQPATPPTVPVEKLIESMQPEKPLGIESTAIGGSAGAR